MHSTLSRNSILLPALTMALAFAGCAAAPKPLPPHEPVALANPASVNCVRLSGTLAIVKREDGGEYGVCRFADGRQCEEWALFRGKCTPEGGAYVDWRGQFFTIHEMTVKMNNEELTPLMFPLSQLSKIPTLCSPNLPRLLLT